MATLMSYTVLARRYRSSTFDEVVGQNHVAQTLKRAIETGRVAHAFMFCGTRGTGKTSMARILAKALNCERFDKATVTPCGECRSCVAISKGDDIDVIEIDAASNRGIDEVRRIIENSRLAPGRSRYKIYIIDEVHAMSKDAFNALLKVLEEPASHVKFILATTEPEKVLPTILSRCQRYDFHNIPVREIAAHLISICKQEGVTAQQDAVILIAKAGNGSMRDAISVLDRLLSAGSSELTVEMIEQMLGLPRSQQLFDLVQAIGTADVKLTLNLVNNIIFQGLSIDTLLASMIDHIRNLLIVRICGIKNDLVEAYGINADDLQKQAERFDPVTLAQDIVILEELRRATRQSQASRALLDATLVRLALAEQYTPTADLIEQNTTTPAADSAAKKKAEPLARAPAFTADPDPFASDSPLHEASPAGSANAMPESPPTEIDSFALSEADEAALDDALPAVGKVFDGPRISLGAMFAGKANQPKPAASPPSRPGAPAGMPDFWPAALESIKERLGPGIYTPLLAAEARLADGIVVLRFTGAFTTMAKFLDKSRDAIQEIITEVSGQSLGVRLEADDSAAPPHASGMGVAPGVGAGHQHAPQKFPPVQGHHAVPRDGGIPITPELRAELEKDPLVRAILESLGGNIVKYE